MKVKKINKSSKRTSQVIKEAFAELLSEKKELNKVKVIDLVNFIPTMKVYTMLLEKFKRKP